jgi:hypothetical protein
VIRPVRIVLACIILLSTVSISVSSASPVQAQGSTSPIHVKIDWAPTKIVCLGETAQVGIFHYWDRDSNPMVPLDGQPLLVTSSKHGSVDQPSLTVTSFPGLARMTYTAETSGTETLSTTFSYGPTYSATATTTFKVRKCNYKLSIRADAFTDMNDVQVGSEFEAIGNIYVTDDKIMGELNGYVEIYLRSNNDAYNCSLVPESKSNAKVTVTGTQDTNVWGSTVTHLQIVFQPVSGFPATNEVCNDKTSDHLEIRNTPFPTPNRYDPSADLKTTLDFKSNGYTLQGGPFGKNGHAHYILEPIDDTSSGNGN